MLLAGGHADRAHAVVGGFDRAFLVAACVVAGAAVLAALTARMRRSPSGVPEAVVAAADPAPAGTS